MTTTKVTSLLESSGFAATVRLLREACSAQFPDGERPVELVALETALYDAEEAAQMLDDATA